MITILTWGQTKRDTYPKVHVEVSCLGLDNPPLAMWNLDGRDVELRTFIAFQISFNKQRQSWFNRVEDELLKLAAKNTDLSIGFYCHGGRHRSVSVAELIKKILRKQGYKVAIRHLEL